MCGDYHMWYVLIDKAEGSPPHVRGLQHDPCYREMMDTITPPCAGTTQAAA